MPRLLLAIVLYCMASVASAACHSFASGFICNTRSQAEAYIIANSTASSISGPVVSEYDAIAPFTVTQTGHPFHGLQAAGRVQCGSGNPDYPLASCATNPGWGHWLVGPTSSECEDRNNNPDTAPGERLCAGLECGSARCVAGCSLDISGEPTRSFPGRVAGQPATFYGFQQSYTGETCDGTEPNPDAELTPPGENSEDRCNANLGICVTPDNKTKYCTFNPDGSVSACVPAVDYDNDGIPDEDDIFPADPTNGDDKEAGNESDNRVSGGAGCALGSMSCTGDGIACAIAFQTWRTRCAVEALDIGDGGGSFPTGEFQYDPATAAAQGNDLHPTLASVIGNGDDPWSMSNLQEGSFTVSRACPALAWPSLSLAGMEVGYPGSTLCGWLSILAGLILLAGYVQAAYIVMRVGR